MITRLGLDGYGVRRAGDFSNKSAFVVTKNTRFSIDAYMTRRAGNFAGKQPSVARKDHRGFLTNVGKLLR